MEPALKVFFSSPRFAVAGASSDRRKFGHKVFAWYLAHNLPVTAINPSCSSINVPIRGASNNTYETVSKPSALPTPQDFALSVITAPPVTRQLLQDAKQAGIRAVWLQPGTFDKEVLEYARREWPDAAIAGTDVPGTVGGEGWCVLVDGERAMQVAGRTGNEERL